MIRNLCKQLIAGRSSQFSASPYLIIFNVTNNLFPPFFHFQDTSPRYKLASVTDRSLQGVISLLNNGIIFVNSQISDACEIFELEEATHEDTNATSSMKAQSLESETQSSHATPAPIISDTETMQSVPMSATNPGSSPSMEHDVAFRNVVDAHCQAEKLPFIYENDTDDSDSESEFSLNLEPPSFIRTPRTIFHTTTEPHTGRTCVILYEEKFSQDKVGGRYGGSYACSFVCTLFAKIMSEGRLILTDYDDRKFSNTFLEKAIFVAMEQGNRLYDYCRKSLPHRYCSMEEVADMVSSICPFVVKEVRPVWIVNDDYLLTLKGQLEFLMMFDEWFVTIFTYNEQASIFYSYRKCISFIDTHCHIYKGEIGGTVYVFTDNDLDDFVAWVASMSGIPKSGKGSLTFIKFK